MNASPHAAPKPSLMQRIGCLGGFALGFVTGFITLFVLIMAFGDYDDEPAVAQQPVAPVVEVAQAAPQQPDPVVEQPTSTPEPTSTPAPVGLTYEEVCEVDERNMTDPQLEAHARSHEGQTFTNWQGWVYDVVSRYDGTYNLEIAMEPRGFLWTRDIVIENIPTDLAHSLNVEQVIVFSGRTERVEVSFGVMCNPLVAVMDNYTVGE